MDAISYVFGKKTEGAPREKAWQIMPQAFATKGRPDTPSAHAKAVPPQWRRPDSPIGYSTTTGNWAATVSIQSQSASATS